MQTHQHVSIPLSKLVLSPKNVRTSQRSSIKELANSILTQGILHSFVVTKSEDHGKEQFEVVDGGRRLEALQLLHKNGDIKATYPVDCTVVPDEGAVAASLTANIARQDMHALDQFRSYLALSNEGKSVEDIAALFSVTPLVVKRRLKLANIAPSLLALFAKDKIDLEALMAFASTDDHKRQEAVWAGLPAHSRGAWAIRRALTENEIPGDDPRVRFVGVKSYEKHGGGVRTDLFSDKATIYIQDVALLDRLALAKLDEKAEQLKDEEGLSWVESRLHFDYSDRSAFGVVPTVHKAPTAKQAAKLTALEAELAALVAKSDADQESDEEGDDTYEAIEDVTEKIEGIKKSLERPDPRAVAVAGAIVTVDHNGKVEVFRGLVKSEDKKALKVLAKADPNHADDGKGVETDDESELSGSLRLNLSTHFTAALRAKVATAPGVALRALTAALVRSRDLNYHTEATVLVRATEPHLRSNAPEIEQTKAAADYAALDAGWQAQLAGQGDVFGWLCGRTDEVVLSLLAHCTAACVSAVCNSGPGVEARDIAERAGLDMREYWSANGESYLKRVPKALILDALREVDASLDLTEFSKSKKGALIAMAEPILVAARWLPPMLRGRESVK
jgi:ParB family chromosome partitioning protein